jgi:hypothetical protein
MPPEARATIKWMESAIKNLEGLTTTHFTDYRLAEILKPESNQKVLDWAIKQATR